MRWAPNFRSGAICRRCGCSIGRRTDQPEAWVWYYKFIGVSAAR